MYTKIGFKWRHDFLLLLHFDFLRAMFLRTLMHTLIRQNLTIKRKNIFMAIKGMSRMSDRDITNHSARVHHRIYFSTSFR